MSLIFRHTYTAPWHYNTEYELVYFLEGNGTQFLGDDIRPFKAPCMVFMAPLVPHQWRDATHALPKPNLSHRPLGFGVLFKENFLGDCFFAAPEMLAVRHLFNRARRGLEVSGRTREVIGDRMRELVEAQGLGRLVILLEIINRLVTSKNLRPIASAGYKVGANPDRSQRLAKAHDYILSHLGDEIRRDDVAAHVGLSGAGFSRFFHRTTCKRFVDFVNAVRVAEACRQLTESDQTITEIAFGCGFTNLSNLNRRFRMLKGVSPREYRQRCAPHSVAAER